MPAHRGFPFLPSLIILLAVPLMIGLGIWQYQRHLWKTDLLQAHAHNMDKPLLIIDKGPIPTGSQFREVRLHLDCPAAQPRLRGGQNRQGETGFAHLLACRAGGEAIELDIGWSARPDELQIPALDEPVTGLFLGDVDHGRFLIADQPLPPLQASARPTPDSIANNHLSYALQWWSFATILLVIYAIWLRRRLASAARPH